MLLWSVVCFTFVIALGVLLAIGVFRGTPSSKMIRLFHGVLAVAGLGMVTTAMSRGDTRLGINVALGAVVILLGVIIGLIRIKKMNPSALVACHIWLAAMFYIILVFFTFVPSF
ncbi:hypothetical protein [Acidomonas methanolica]|uniref:hypothetical protein n=1 Tax=Acidomonas methanolica TaxID=437 RepID=UPI00211A52CC|nr:hypothetical protein [Acidomonas methanolica]MCQ9156573.1 hypothetical protein [Acidomonas methanolica]